MLRFLGNLIWLIFGGIVLAAAWFLLGLVLCITIIGIPIGKQCFKFARLTLAPFGKTVDTDFGAHPFLNIVWMIFLGWEMALASILAGAALCVTIVGIPFGLQAFKMAIAYLMPFGAEIKYNVK